MKPDTSSLIENHADHKIILAEDHPVVRNSIKTILTKDFKNIPILEADNQELLVELVKQKECILLILDLFLTDGSTLHLIPVFKSMQHDMRIIFFSGSSETVFAQKAIKLGADAYINKRATEPEMVEAIKLVMAGKKYISQELQYRMMFEEFGKPPFDQLTEREMEISLMLLSGNSISKIASKIHLQTSTVCTHRNNIYNKLQIDNIVDFIHLAEAWGINCKATLNFN